jgi:hypothetical protein
MGESKSFIGLSRQKYWKELTADEKVERLRSEVKRLSSLCIHLSSILERLREHQHAQGGGILVPFDQQTGQHERAGNAASNDEVYI